MTFGFQKRVAVGLGFSTLFSILIISAQGFAKSVAAGYQCITGDASILDVSHGVTTWIDTIYAPAPDDKGTLQIQRGTELGFFNLVLITPQSESTILENVLEAAWSPDGQYIIYKTLTPDDVFKLGFMDADGNVISDVEILTRTDDFYNFWSYGFSPDLQYLALSFRVPDGAEIQFRSVPDLQLVRSINVEELPMTGLWSSQGHVFGAASSYNIVSLMTPEDGQFVSHAFAGYGLPRISWSPDGRFMVYESSSNAMLYDEFRNVTTLGMLEIDGSDHPDIATISFPASPSGGGIPDVVWSEDNQSFVVWRSSGAQSYELIRYYVEDGHSKTLVDGWSQPGVSSPNQRYTTFYRFVEDGTVSVELVDIHENTHRVVGEYSISRGFPERFIYFFWAPDSSGVVVGFGMAHIGFLWFDVAGNYPMQVIEGVYPRGTQWSVNQHSLFYAAGSQGQVNSIARLDIHTGEQEVIVDDLAYAAIPYSPLNEDNSGGMVYWESAGQAGYDYYNADGELLFRYHLAVVNTALMNRYTPTVSFAPDRQHFVFWGGLGGTNMEYYSLETNTGNTLVDPGEYSQVAWSPDSQSFSILVVVPRQFQSVFYIFRADGIEIGHYALKMPYYFSSQTWTDCG
ncbi:MAG: hypothetical protein U0694_12760 [Anaerolineae bacterium]